MPAQLYLLGKTVNLYAEAVDLSVINIRTGFRITAAVMMKNFAVISLSHSVRHTLRPVCVLGSNPCTPAEFRGVRGCAGS